ncbi:hypothetical protein [Bacillus timonensis]|uniref:hypothetical protein n=1 Tax=Bacillus timonensis TaxID=1033734 RepID=UPI0002E04BDE|nr:hypothetical protein [Bacillus timonensis]
MNDNQIITSFVVRCALINVDNETMKKQWRIKISHVQGENEVVVTDLEDAVQFMKRVIEE